MSGQRPTVFGRINVQALAPTNGVPTTVTQSVPHETRVVVRNIGGVDLFFATDSTALANQTATSNAYQLPPGQSDVLVIVKDQGLYVAGLGAGGVLTYAMSSSFMGPGFGA